MDEATSSSSQGDVTDVSEVDSTPLDLNDHLFDVQSELIPVAANWRSIGIALRLKLDVLESIETRFKGDPNVCLLHMVTEWLKRNFDVKKFGEPTWQKLVKAVGHPAGGANTALAQEIAGRHKAEDGTVTIRAAGRSRSAGEASLKAPVMKLARKYKSESEANSEITEQGANSGVPVTQQTSPSPQGDTETEMSSSPTISDTPFSPSPIPDPGPVKRVTSSPTHQHPQSNPAASTQEPNADFACENRQTITAKFGAFQTKVCDKLFKNGVDTEHFRLFVINQFPPGDCIPPPPASLTEIFKAITYHGLWDYLHYSPLVHIVQTFGADDSEMKDWVQTYKRDLKAYSFVTKVEKYVEADSDIADPPPTKKAKYDPRYYRPVEWKTNFHVDHTLQYLTEVWELFSSRYLVPDDPPTALLDRVREGCFVVTWLVPTGLISRLIERVKTDTKFFQQHHILRVTVGEECVYEEVTEKAISASVVQADPSMREGEDWKHKVYQEGVEHTKETGAVTMPASIGQFPSSMKKIVLEPLSEMENESGAVAMGEDWKLDLKQKEMQQAKETGAVAMPASVVQVAHPVKEREDRRLEPYQEEMEYAKEAGAVAVPASTEQVSPSMKKKLLESSSSQERLEHTKDQETGAVAMVASVKEGKGRELEPYEKEMEHAKSEMPASKPLRPKGGLQMSQLKEVSAQKETVGYECEFVDPPPSAFQTECLICQLVLREPYQTNCCGTSFCQTCIQRVQDNESSCPTCREEDFQVFPNKGLKRSLNQLHVYCKHSKDGCTWSGELQAVEEHINEEETQLVGCQFAEIQCEFHYAGCKFHSTRKDMAIHMSEQLSYHTELLTGKMNDRSLIEQLTKSLQRKDKIIYSLQEKLTSVQREGASRKDEQPIPSEPIRIDKIFTMDKFQEHKENDSQWYSPPFYTHPRGYKMCLRVDANGYDKASGTHLSLFTCFMKGEFDSKLPWPFYGQIVVELINQNADNHHHEYTIYYNHSTTEYAGRMMIGTRSRGWGNSPFVSHAKLLKKSDSKVQYLKDDCLKFRVREVHLHTGGKISTLGLDIYAHWPFVVLIVIIVFVCLVLLYCKVECL